MNKHSIIIIAGILALLSGCSDRPTNPVMSDTLPDIYPDYTEVTIPAQIAPLNFNVKGATAVDVTVTGNKGGEIHTNGKYAKFDIGKWHSLVAKNTADTLFVSVCAKIGGQWIKYPDFNIYVSEYPIDEWGLTYRRIAPGYEVYSDIGLYQRCLADFDETPIIENTQTPGQCYNCHTANRTDPEQFVFHVRGPHGATMIQQHGEREWLKATNDSIHGAMVYPYWHPSGRFCAFSTNQTRQGFHTVPDERIEVFDLSSDILVYDIDRHEILLDTLLTKKDWSENLPTFSPDGKWLYFTTCKQKSYPLEFKDEKYNLCRIAFDPDKRQFGTEVDTVFDAVSMGKSVTWPRPSYDGRFMIFTLVDYGYFSIWHREADQWMLDMSTCETRPLETINSPDADSYHNWSDNSRWIVFTSRRDDGLYSRLYLSSVDDNGNVTKPFMLPQADPLDYYGKSLYSFNTPDFTKTKVKFDKNKAVGEIMSDKRVETKIAK